MTKPSRPILGLNQGWDTFLMSILFALVLPLLPLVIEKKLTGDLGMGSLVAAAAIYAVSIGVTSKSRALFAACVLGGFFIATGYGIALRPSPTDHVEDIRMSSWVGIASVFLLHGIERYQRHVLQLEPFMEF